MATKTTDEALVLADAAKRFCLPRNRLITHSHQQTWPDTSCGFPGIGARVITVAQTHVIEADGNDQYLLVYHKGRFAYQANPKSERFWEMVYQRKLIGLNYAPNYDFYLD